MTYGSKIEGKSYAKDYVNDGLGMTHPLLMKKINNAVDRQKLSVADIQKVWDGADPKHLLFDPRMHSSLSFLCAPAVSVAIWLRDKFETLTWVAYLSSGTEAHLRYAPSFNVRVGKGWLE